MCPRKSKSIRVGHTTGAGERQAQVSVLRHKPLVSAAFKINVYKRRRQKEAAKQPTHVVVFEGWMVL